MFNNVKGHITAPRLHLATGLTKASNACGDARNVEEIVKQSAIVECR